MKKFGVLFLLIGISVVSFGQIVNGSINIVLNDDKTPLRATYVDDSIVYTFKKTDVLAVTCTDVKLDVSKKRVEIVRENNNTDILVKSFDTVSLIDDKSCKLEVPLNDLNSKIEYYLIVIDGDAKQALWKFLVE